MRSRRSVGPFLVLLLAGCPLVSCKKDPNSSLLEHQEILQSFDWLDNLDWSWYESRIPFLETPDRELDATYYYRWELITKHLVYGSPESGYTFTEFIDRPFWSGKYGAISCPLGHQAYEIRWLKDRRIIEDFARYWFETPGAEPRRYSNWYGDAMWATYLVLGDRDLLGTVYPHMASQVEGWTEERWDPDHEMYRWVGAWDGMETNINSRLTDDSFAGAEGYRPTLNSYLYGDLVALSNTEALFGEEERAAEYRARAAALKARVQEELWDPRREFFFHQFASDERDGIRAGSLTYETGPHAGDPHGRELLGYVPWQFGLPDPGHEVAWKFLLDPEYFWTEFGPTGVEQGDPQFWISPSCCVWSGNAWPYATAQTLTAMANLLHDYDQDVVRQADYYALLSTYARSHRQGGRPYLAEASDPYTGSWSGHNTFYHSEHYLHSGFLDQVITGLIGLRPRADDTLVVNPLVPEEWDFFALEGVDYHGHKLNIAWDRDGSRYSLGSGLTLFLNGHPVARRQDLGEVRIAIPPPATPVPEPRQYNYAVNNGSTHFPHASASSVHPAFPPFYAVDGNRWYHPSPPNRWVADRLTEEDPRVWFEVDFGAPRPLTRVSLYFLDDASGPSTEVVGEEEDSGFPLSALRAGPPVLPPRTVTIEYWDGLEWTEVSGAEGEEGPPVGRREYAVRFQELITSKVRVVLERQPGATVGLTEIEAWGPGGRSVSPAEAPIPNLALNPSRDGFPKISASFTNPGDSPWEAVDGNLALTRYSRNRWTAYGSPNREDWVEVDLGMQRLVEQIDVFFYGDGAGVAAPEDYRIEVWGGSEWKEPSLRWRKPSEPLAWALNQTRLEPVRTSRLRVVLLHRAPSASGIAEIRIWE